MTFFLDYLMLLGSGIMISLVSKRFYREGSRLVQYLSILMLIIFYSVSIPLFCELNSNEHGFFGVIAEFFFNVGKFLFPEYYINHPSVTSCEFMYSSAIELFKPLVPFNNLTEMVTNYKFHLALGIMLFACYPLLLYIGIKIGSLIFVKTKRKEEIN